MCVHHKKEQTTMTVGHGRRTNVSVKIEAFTERKESREERERIIIVQQMENHHFTVKRVANTLQIRSEIMVPFLIFTLVWCPNNQNKDRILGDFAPVNELCAFLLPFIHSVHNISRERQVCASSVLFGGELFHSLRQISS